MAGTTTKLSLYLPGGGSSGLITPDEQLDIDKINDNMKKIDVAIGFVVCTSGTRPSTPFTGQSIIETDTRNTMYWNASRWVPLDTLPNAASDPIRNALYPAPIAGNQVFRTDLSYGGAIQIFNGSVWKNLGVGRIPMYPTSVAGTGVSVSGNKINFVNNLSGMSLYGIFTDEFDLYDVTIAFMSGGTGLVFQGIDDGGVVDTGTNWETVTLIGSGAAASSINSGLVVSATIVAGSSINGNFRMRVSFARSIQAGLFEFEGTVFSSSTAGNTIKGGSRRNISGKVGGLSFQFSAAASGYVIVEGVRG